MTKLLLELPDDLAGDLNSLASLEGKPIERYAINALFDHAVRTATLPFFPEPPIITEGSPEEDLALEEALNGSFHPFHADEARRKISQVRY